MSTYLSSVSIRDIVDFLQDAAQAVSPASSGANAGANVGRQFAASAGSAPAAATSARFDSADLYDASGAPRPQDVDQDSIGDCYFVATLAALADKQPERIRNAITYDSATGAFTVTLYKPEWSWSPPGWKQVRISVTQQDLQNNLNRSGGSTVDNKSGVDGPIWPAVMETAYAKLHDSNWSNGLDQGYRKIEGGWAKDAMFALTGSEGDNYSQMAIFSSDTQAEILFAQVASALADGRPVTLSTDPESLNWGDFMKTKKIAQDGLVDDHVYMVERIYKNASGEVMVQLCNPWGSNNNVGEGMDGASATITVALEKVIETGGLECFNAGPRK